MIFPRLTHFFALAGLLAGLSPALAADASGALDRAALLRTLSLDMAAHYGIEETLEIDLVRPWEAPESAAAVAVVEYPSALASSVLVRVRYLKDKAVLREDVLALRVQLWRDALVTRVPLGREAPLALDGLEIRRVDALREREALPAGIIGQDYVCARALPAGRQLVWRDVARRALVKKGSLVEVSAVDGRLSITMKALAMQDGARGEVVRVRNVDSRREFTALVVADNRAEVRF